MMEQHPTLPVVAVSGIDSTVKVSPPSSPTMLTLDVRTRHPPPRADVQPHARG